MMRTEWIMTASGRAFYPTAPVLEDIDIEDISHALACVNRFQGHTREPYSVAQHSVLLSYEMARLAPADHARALYGLLHDASEAYLCDVPRPLKRLPEFAPYREAEVRLQAAIYEAFGLDVRNEPADLKEFDRRMLRTEQAQLMPPAAPGETRTDVPVFPILISVWPWMWAREMFRLRFRDLFNLRSSADGTAPGVAIPIFGGKRGDIPLERGANLLAQLAAREEQIARLQEHKDAIVDTLVAQDAALAAALAEVARLKDAK